MTDPFVKLRKDMRQQSLSAYTCDELITEINRRNKMSETTGAQVEREVVNTNQPDTASHEIVCLDEAGQGGMCHEYEIRPVRRMPNLMMLSLIHI